MVGRATFGKRVTPPAALEQSRDDAGPGVIDTVAPALSWNKLDATRFWRNGDDGGSRDHRRSDIILFDQPINHGSLGDLERRVNERVDAGLNEITIVVTSPGGLLDPTLRLYERLISLPVKLKTHGRYRVASAANVLFLAGGERTAHPCTTFLFHPVYVPVQQGLTRAKADANSQVLLAQEQRLAQLYLARTRLSSSAIAEFSQASVVYDARTALSLGIIDRIEMLSLEAADANLALQKTPSTTVPG
jgi:ATP-dependent protease ClpP protease subunit